MYQVTKSFKTTTVVNKLTKAIIESEIANVDKYGIFQKTNDKLAKNAITQISKFLSQDFLKPVFTDNFNFPKYLNSDLILLR